MVKKTINNPKKGHWRAGDTRHDVFPSPRRWLSYTISALLVAQPALPVYAANIDIASGNTRTDQAGNGVPIVDIATPNQAGISHNKYNDFNVGKEGLILNNSTDRLTQTQLGGLIQNNTNLKAGKEAVGIINEVVGSNRSQLQGYIEVGGKAASVMVANPYGITCDGCGFINTPNATLTTGKPVMGADGNVQALEVSRGTITVQGKGLDAGDVDAFRLISRATEINAEIHAKDLTVITGTNRVNKDGTITTIAADEKEKKPTVSIDTKRLGGMYANRIRLVSSEKGVGVNLGNLNARQGDIQIDANGKLRLNNSLAAGKLTAKSEGMELSGAHRAEQGIQLASKGDMALNEAALSSGKDLSLNASGQLTINKSQLRAGADTKGNLNRGSSLSVAGGSQTITGSRLSADKVNISATHSLSQDKNSQFSAMTDLDVEAETLALNGRSEADNDVTLRAGRLNIGTESLISAQRDVRVNVSDEADLHGRITATRDLTLSAAKVSNKGELRAGRNGRLESQQLNNQGVIQAQADQTVKAGKIVNGGSLSAQDTLDVEAASLSNGGWLGARKDVSLNVTDLLNVDASGVLFSDGNLNIRTGQFLLAGLTQGLGDVTVSAADITTLSGSKLLSGADMVLTADSLALAGLVSADGQLSINGKTLRMSDGAYVQAQNALAVNISHSAELRGVFHTLGTLSFSGGEVDHQAQSTAGRISVNAEHLANSGLLQADGRIDVQAQTIVQQGIVLAQGVANFTVNTLVNSGSISAGDLTIAARDELNNGGSGTLTASGSLSLSAWRAENRGRINGGSIGLLANEVNNAGYIQATRDLNISATQRLDSHSTLLAGQRLTLQGGSVYNDGVMQGQSMQVSAGNLKNDGTMQGIDSVGMDIDGTLSNSGYVLSSGELAINAHEVENTGTIEGNTMLKPFASLSPLRSRIAGSSFVAQISGNHWNSPLQEIPAGGTTETHVGAESIAETAIDNAFDGLSALQQEKPNKAPRETGKEFTDRDTFIATDYFLDRIDLHPDYDYRFAADDALNNMTLKTSDTHYLNGIGTEMAQLQALIDRAAAQDSGVRLADIRLSADLISSLTRSLVNTAKAEGHGKPILYLAPDDIQLLDGSIIGSGKIKL